MAEFKFKKKSENNVLLSNGRFGHDGVFSLGDIKNAIVDVEPRNTVEEKQKINEYHKNRENVKKAQAEAFSKKVEEVKPEPVKDKDKVKKEDKVVVKDDLPEEEEAL